MFGKPGTVYLDPGLLVRPDAAEAALPKPEPERNPTYPPKSDPTNLTVNDGRAGGATPVTGRGPSASDRKQGFKRFHATIDIDPQDPIGSFTEVVENVIEHLSAQYGTEVTVSIDVEARRPSGFDTNTVRTVRENAATLKFQTAEFEEE